MLAQHPDGVFLSNGPGRPRCGLGHVFPCGEAARQGADVRHLPRASDDGQSRRRRYREAQVRSSRRQPSRDEPSHRAAWRSRLKTMGSACCSPACGELVPDLSGGYTEHHDDLRFWVRAGIAPVVRNERFGRIQLTHVNLNDGTVEGVAFLDVPAFCVQYHPEAAPGPDRRALSVQGVRAPDGGTQGLSGHRHRRRSPGGMAVRRRSSEGARECLNATISKPSWSSAQVPSSSVRRASSITPARRRARCSRTRAIAWCWSTPTRRPS